MHVADDVTRHPVLETNLDHALLAHELCICAENNLPDVSPLERFPLFEPFDHFFHERGADRVRLATVCTG